MSKTISSLDSTSSTNNIKNLNDILVKLSIKPDFDEKEIETASVYAQQINVEQLKYIDKEILKVAGITKIGDRIKILNYIKGIDNKNCNSIKKVSNLLQETNMNYNLQEKHTVNFILNDGAVHSVNLQGCYTADSIKMQLLKVLNSSSQYNYQYPLNSKQFDVFSIEQSTDESEYKLCLLYDVELVTISHSTDKYLRKRLIFVPQWETPSKVAIWRCKKIIKSISELNPAPANKDLVRTFKESLLNAKQSNENEFIKSPLNTNQRPATNLISNNLQSYFPKTSKGKLKSTVITSLKKSYQQSLHNPREYQKNQNRNSKNIGSVFLNDSERLEREVLKDPDFDKMSTFSRQSLCASLIGMEDEDLEEDFNENEYSEMEIEGNWIKGSKLGSGSYGNVFLGLHSQLGTLMAVKQVPFVDESGTLITDKDINSENKEEEKKSSNDKKMSNKMVEALSREIVLLQSLKHENIVEYMGSSNEEGFLNIFLEYVPGGSISQMLSSYGPLEESLVRSFTKQILVGISYLHRKNVIHRDIKGANILIDTQGIVKITDFGISTKLPKRVRNQWLKKKKGANEDEEDDIDDERKASLQGSVFWMAPEVVKQITITSKADIWSIGCVLIEMCTARHPFPEYSQMQALFKIGTNVVPKLPTLNEFESEKQSLSSKYKHNKITDLSTKGRIFLSKCLVLDFQRRPNSVELLNNSWLLEELL
ncbi:hypothetical protein QEN19_003798 [Hanseniaspora menglaensis]